MRTEEIIELPDWDDEDYDDSPEQEDEDEECLWINGGCAMIGSEYCDWHCTRRNKP